MSSGRRFRGSTLVEVLILMILSGIIFLSVMDGLTLLRRFLSRTAGRIAEQTQQYAGYFRTADLIASSDSLILAQDSTIALYREGAFFARIEKADSALVVRTGERTDTLLRGIVFLHAAPNPRRNVRADTLITGIRTGRDSALRVGFAPEHSPNGLSDELAATETRYRYEK